VSQLSFEDINVQDYRDRFYDSRQPHLLLDVRTVEEFEEARVPGAVNVPLDELPGRVAEISQIAGDTPIVVVCRSGHRSIMAAQILRFSGLTTMDIYNLDTGTLGWARHRGPLDRGPRPK
jgi:rhodanese-related sulfurtransferase